MINVIKEKKAKQDERTGSPREKEDTATHREVIRMGCTEKVTFEQQLEGSIPFSSSHIWM